MKNVYAGTTVTQPDGSTVYVDPPRTIKEKIREALMAIKLEQGYDRFRAARRFTSTARRLQY